MKPDSKDALTGGLIIFAVMSIGLGAVFSIVRHAEKQQDELRKRQRPEVDEEIVTALLNSDTFLDALKQYKYGDGKRERVAEKLVAIVRPHLAPVAGGWMPIESAPRNKTIVLVWNGDCHLAYFEQTKYTHFTGWFILNNGDYNDGGYGHDYKMGEYDDRPSPTHWMPLPAAPQPPQAKGARE